jgi:hypothetical protein
MLIVIDSSILSCFIQIILTVPSTQLTSIKCVYCDVLPKKPAYSEARC